MSNDTRQKLADGAHKWMLDVLDNGQQMLDQKTGEIIRVCPTPAMLKVILEEAKRLGVSDVPVHNTPAGKLTERVNKHLKLTGTDGALSKPIEDFAE
jgi:hypothetical protein